MSNVIYPGRDPLGFLEFLTTAKRFPFIAKIPDGQSWMSFRQAMNRQLEDYFQGMFDIVLGDESLLTDQSAQFVLYVEQDEIALAEEYLKIFEKSG